MFDETMFDRSDDTPPEPTGQFPRVHGPSTRELPLPDVESWVPSEDDVERRHGLTDREFWAEQVPRRNAAGWAAGGVLAALLLPSLVSAVGIGQSLRIDDVAATASSAGGGPVVTVVIGTEASAPLPTPVAPTVPIAPSSGDAGDSSAPAASSSDDDVQSASGTQTASTATTDTSDAGADAADSGEETLAEARATECAARYTVGDGDFWIRIADESGTPLADLLDLNDATVQTPVHPGSTVCLPPGATMPSPPVFAAPEQPTAAQPAATQPPATQPPSTQPPATQPPATQPPATQPPTTTTTTTQPAQTFGGSQIEQIIRDIWPDSLEERALVIAWRESNHRPDVRNYCCFGLFQIYYEVHKDWLAGMGVTSAEQLYDPVVNTRAAYALYQRAGGWGPWAQTAGG